VRSDAQRLAFSRRDVPPFRTRRHHPRLFNRQSLLFAIVTGGFSPFSVVPVHCVAFRQVYDNMGYFLDQDGAATGSQSSLPSWPPIGSPLMVTSRYGCAPSAISATRAALHDCLHQNRPRDRPWRVMFMRHVFSRVGRPNSSPWPPPAGPSCRASGRTQLFAAGRSLRPAPSAA